MEKSQFDAILDSEGITSQVLKDALWRDRPGFINLDEARVRATCKAFLQDYPHVNSYDDLRPEAWRYR